MKLEDKNILAKSYVYEEIQKVIKPVKDYVIIKGDVLSYFAYGAYGLRTMSDIDILISPKEINVIENSLLENGFEKVIDNRETELFMKSFSHQIVPFVKKDTIVGNIYIDVNFDILWGEYEGVPIRIEKFLENKIELEIYGVILNVLNPLYMFIQLVLHTYKDMNSIFLLSQRQDEWYAILEELYIFLKNNINNISICDLLCVSETYQIRPYIYYILYYIDFLFNDTELKKYLQELYSEKGELLVDCFGLNERERRKWPCTINERIFRKDRYSFIKDILSEKDFNKIIVNSSYMKGEIYNARNIDK